jgi:23S rRNA (guanine2445-N2)-methyltransferase / 23S rRNA (guanine2069-N7)-methyltransferase
LHVQEYAPPATVDADKAERRLEQVRVVLSAVLEVPPERVFLKVRQRQKGVSQYEKQAAQGRFHEVQEGPCRLLVNFEDYLDTGLFLDQRLTRRLIGEWARDRRFLNLFGYTGTATVYAALGGAATTTTVDLSRTYLEWAERNLVLNGVKVGPQQRLIQADCREWLADGRESFNLIFLDPPTFSNSRRMAGTFEVQRDHRELIGQAGQLLAADGILLFSTNHQRFKLDREGLADWRITEMTRQTIPRDFERNPRIHQCWRIER